MAVYTEVAPDMLAPVLARFFPEGRLSGLTPISAGIENTNYFLDVELGGETRRLVLTLFETLPPKTLPFFARLTTRLAHAGLPVPAPLTDVDGNWVFRVAAKPALLLPCMPGRHVTTPDDAQRRALGAFMAAMHGLTAGLPGDPHPRDLRWMREVLAVLPEAARGEVSEAVERWAGEAEDVATLPEGIVHGDLFVDNALFEGDRLTGVIDFYHAARAPLLFDVAVALNDWCFGKDDYDDAACRALLSGYRPFTDTDIRLFPAVLRLAALRFWLSRLRSLHSLGYQHEAKAGDTLKDPEQMAQRYRAACRLGASRVRDWLAGS